MIGVSWFDAGDSAKNSDLKGYQGDIFLENFFESFIHFFKRDSTWFHMAPRDFLIASKGDNLSMILESFPRK